MLVGDIRTVLYVLAAPPILCGRVSDEAFENPREVALVGETRRQGYPSDGRSLPQSGLRPRDAHLQLVGMWRHSNLSAKRSVQMVGAQSHQSGKFLERDSFCIVLVQEFLQSPHSKIFLAIAR